MPSKKATKQDVPPAPSRRYPITPEERDSSFMTAAEARGAAAWMVMHALLRRIPRAMCKSVMAQCYYEIDSRGDQAVAAEVESLFWNIDFRDQAHNRADG